MQFRYFFSANTVLVRVFGLRPENILFYIHEVLESLIQEFFRGVRYEFALPCRDCVDERTEEPCMFSSKVLRKAIEMKALFLQCHAFFHTLSINDVQGGTISLLILCNVHVHITRLFSLI